MASQPVRDLRESPRRRVKRDDDAPEEVFSTRTAQATVSCSSSVAVMEDATERNLVTPPMARRANNVNVKLEDNVAIVSDGTPTKAPQQQLVQRPTYEECRFVVEELGKLHPDVVEECRQRQHGSLNGSCGTQDCLLDGLVSTILSQNTTNANSSRAFLQLKESFPTWRMVEQLPHPPTQLEQAIQCGGLAKIKAQRIHSILKTITQERGSPPSLEYLHQFSNDQVKKELLRFPGLGPKTISCLLLFAMNRPEFPVDTHVHRITQQRLKWISNRTSREQAYEQLNASIPDEFKLTLHCLLIAHGRQCHRCAARGRPQFPPKDGSPIKCPLTALSIDPKMNGQGRG